MAIECWPDQSPAESNPAQARLGLRDGRTGRPDAKTGPLRVLCVFFSASSSTFISSLAFSSSPFLEAYVEGGGRRKGGKEEGGMEGDKGEGGEEGGKAPRSGGCMGREEGGGGNTSILFCSTMAGCVVLLTL